MDRLWSPWRSKHVAENTARAQNDDGPSLFSRLASEHDDEKNLILWRGDLVFVIMNLYPYNNGHLMIIPFREVASYDELETPEQYEIATSIDLCIRALRRALSPEGFNVGMNLEMASGAGFPGHMHVHVVPRWGADTSFMTTTSEVRVIPEALSDTFAKLKTAFAAEVGISR